jgi:hypothetical protein
MPSSTFHDRVKEGLIVPIKHMRGFYRLNDSLRRLVLREVPGLPKPVAGRSLQDIVRLAYFQGVLDWAALEEASGDS